MKTTILTSAALLLSASCFADTVDLFNGKDTDNWNLYLQDQSVDSAKVFTVEDGILNINGQPFGFMSTKDEFEDFYLHAEWKYPEGASNSGIFLFVQNSSIWPNAVEVQLFSGRAADFVLLGGSDIEEYAQPEGKPRPEFPVVRRNDGDFENAVGEWNSADIICKDGKITVFINGKLANTGTSKNKKGHIALQSEGGKIQFRNVHLTEL